MSHAQWSRIERGVLLDLSFSQASRAASAVGLRLDVRLYPDGDPARDAGQLALLERFRLRLPAGTRWDTEVPLPIPGDRRAWDQWLVSRAVAPDARPRRGWATCKRSSVGSA